MQKKLNISFGDNIVLFADFVFDLFGYLFEFLLINRQRG